LATALLICWLSPLPLRAEWEPIVLPTDLEVEALGSGWTGELPSSDPAPLPAEQLMSLSMDQAVRWSSQRNPVIRSAFQNLVATQNSLGAQYARWWPVINVSLTGGLYGQDSGVSGTSLNGGGFGGGGSGGGGSGSGSFGPDGGYFSSIAQVDATWDLIDPSRAPAIWKAKYQVRQAADAYVIAYRDNRLQVESAFIALQAAAAQVQASRLIVDNDGLLLQLTEAKLRLGVASRLDVTKQKTVLFADQVDLEQGVKAVAIARSQLAELLNVDQPDLINPGAALVPLGVWPHSLDQTVEASLAYRKVIQQKLLDVKVFEADAQIALAVYQPTLQLINTLYWNRNAYWTESLRSYVFNPSSALTLTFTGFDGGQARMEAEASRRKSAAAAQDYLTARNSARQEAQADFAKVDVGRKVLLASANEVEQANKAIRLQSLRFNAGYGTITDVVQAQLSLAQSVLSFVENLKDYNQSLTSLARNTGLNYVTDSAFSRDVGQPLSDLERLPELFDRRTGG
jgi:outer membrane protein TolC